MLYGDLIKWHLFHANISFPPISIKSHLLNTWSGENDVSQCPFLHPV